MDYIRFAIENPVKVAVGVILLGLFGIIALTSIPVQLTPDVDQPIISVTTEWTGRSPDEIEREIIEEQEDVLKNVSNLRKMTATADQGQATIELEFFIGTDLKEARQEVSDSLREVPEYPEEAEEPVIVEGEAGAGSPVAWLIFNSQDEWFDVQTLGDPAEDRIKPMLERVPGVSEVRVYGGRDREVHINLDPEKIAQRGITFTQLRQALRLQNINVSAGEVPEGKYDVRVRFVGQYDDLEQIRRTIVAYDEGGPIRIADIGEVDLDYAKQRSFVRSRGNVALALPVYKESGANVIEVMAGLKEALAKVNENVLPIIAMQAQESQGLDAPPQLFIEQVYDETGYIYDALGLVRNNLFIGGVLAVLMLLLFLRSVRPTGVVALAIPISIVGTFVVLVAFGRNINVISLAGLAFAVGMVVDNAIVVLENIDRHLGMGKSPGAAAYDGTKEVWGAIVASTLTTLAVFVPVLTIQEEAGQLFRDIALAICAAVTLSLLVSITVIPSASARFLRTRREPRLGITKQLKKLFGLLPVMSAAVRGYSRFIYELAAPNVPATFARLVIVGAITLLAIVGSWLLMPPTDYLPRGNKNLVFGVILTPPGYNMEQDSAIGERVEAQIRPYWEAETYAELAGQPQLTDPFTQLPIENIPPLDNYFFVSFFGGVFNGATSQDKNNVVPVAGLITAVTNTIPGSIGFAFQDSLFGRGTSGSRSIDVEVSGADLTSVMDSANAVLGGLRGMYGYPSVQPSPGNFDLPAPEVTVELDRVRAADLDLDGDSLGRGVQALVDGVYVGDYRLRGEAIDILVRRDPSIPMTAGELAQMPLAYRNGQGEAGIIPLSNVAQISRTQAPQQIKRIEEQRAVTLTVTPPDAMPLEQVTADIDAMVGQLRDGGAVPRDIEVNLAGSASKLAEVRESLLGTWYGMTWQSLQSIGLSRIFLALLVTYLLMAALFESFLYPFVIMFSVPLAAAGGFLGLAIMHWFIPTQQLDVLTMLGFVILIGVVVNNAILIVHQALNFMRGLGESGEKTAQKLPPREAIRASVESRIRPIFMTTATSVLGMLPLILMPGAGSELYKGLGSVVVGGLTMSTLFTLLVVPLLFSLILDLKAGWLKMLGGELPEHGPDAARTPATHAS